MNLQAQLCFRTGWSSEDIVVARRPRRGRKVAPNRSITEFYYIVHQTDEGNPARPVPVIGPLSDLEYQREKRRLQLPGVQQSVQRSQI